ncbi:MAG: peptide ABC transporter substrate-binding protein [Betaproteobacteria bacterium]|nr:peptide ABC transporter substrate-binding protein [Betaproteobacteria bacterium]
MFFSKASGNMKSVIATAFASATLFVSMNAQAQQNTQADRRNNQEVFLNMGDEPPSMDPNKGVDSVSYFWLGHLFEGLMTTDKNGNIVPGAASNVAVSDSGKTYTFTIRPNAKWHDGKKVTAKDFEYAFQRLVDPAFASEYAFIAETAQIANAAEIIKKKKPVGELGAKATNDSTFVVKLENPVAFFKSLMAFQAFFPVRKDIVEKNGDKFATNVDTIIGNGPFKLVSWKKETSMRMEKASTYWNAAAIKLRAIEAPVMLKDVGAAFNNFRTGGLDMTGLDKERLETAQRERLQVKTYADGGVFFLEMNQRSGKLFENKKLRQALRTAISRREYISKVTGVPGDKPAFGLVPDYMPGVNRTYRQEAALNYRDGDIAGAKKLIKEYLAETKQSKVPPFSILAGDSPNAKKESEYLQALLKNVFGTDVKIDSVPFKTRLQKQRDGQFDIVSAGWGPDYLDAMTFMDLFMTTNGNNHGGYSNKAFDELITKAQRSGSMAERVKLFQEAEKMLVVTDSAIVPIIQRGRAYLLAEGLQGVRRNQVGQDPDFRFASWSGASAKK